MKIIGCNKLGIMLVVLCGVVGLLVGCDEGEFVVDADFGEDSESVVSDAFYYDEVMEYINSYVDFIEDTYRVTLSGDINDTNREKILDATNDFILYSQKFNSDPITEEDNLIYEHFRDFKYDAENVADYTMEYIYKEEDIYLKFLKNSYQNVQVHLDTIARIEKEYFQ